MILENRYYFNKRDISVFRIRNIDRQKNRASVDIDGSDF